ncbi:hypothetical protein GCM10007916_21890 [Psychromonas marina]|uniref:histidine kinase n=2 Tax=Psychromonas marina TaxID=88364 RepID=A0ABQ6E1C4_9GAMM|nr:hypothetical protein GCM10007916_21890 [Psychromonas marina]
MTSWVTLQQAKQSLINETEEKLYQSSEAKHQFINNWFSYRFMDIKTQSSAKINYRLLQDLAYGWSKSEQPLKQYITGYDWAFRTDILREDLVNLSTNYDYIYDIFLIDVEGNILFTVKEEEDLGENLLTGTYSTTKLSQTVAATLNQGTTLFSDIERYGPSNNILTGFLSAPLIDEGEVIGAFVIQLRLDRIFNRLVHESSANTSQSHYLVAEDSLLRSPIYADFNTVLNDKINTEQFKRWIDEDHQSHQPKHTKTAVFEYLGPNNKKVFGIHQLVVINNIRWVLISEIDSEEVLQTSTDIAIVVSIILLLSVLMIIIISIIQAKRITRPLQRLSEASQNVAQGKNNQQVDITSNNEIGRLADSFNEMLNKQQQNEHEIKQSNRQLRGALNELNCQQYALDQHAIVSITDRAGNIVYANDKFCDISGYSHDRLIGANHRILNSGVHSDAFFTELYETISSGNVWQGRVCNQSKNGRHYWVETTITPYKDENDTIQQYISIRTDITKQKAFEEQQEASLKAAAIKLAITNIFTTSHSLRQQLVESLLHLFELPNFKLKAKASLYVFNEHNQSLEMVVRQGKFSFMEKSLEAQLPAMCEQALQSNCMTINPSCTDELCLDTQEHGHYVIPLKVESEDNNVNPANLVGVILIFTEENSGLDDYQVQLLEEAAAIFTNAILRHKANKLLKKATESAEQSNLLKGEFLASMSHEIRTPMNGVLGMLGLLLNSELNADQSHKAKLAKSSAESLLVLINDILDFSKVEAGKMELEVIDFDIRDMLGDLCESMALRAHEKDIEIILDVTEAEFSMVQGDPGRLRQIATNLLSNAIKFTDKGEVKLTAEMHEGKSGEILLTCHVADSGIGIPDDKINNLFEVFTQVDASTTRKYGGTGLGLAISKNLCQLMKGDIRVKSEFNKGSIFTFTAILHESQQSQRVFPNVDISKLNLLIVDDNATNLEVLRGQVEHWGANVIEASSGQQALDICQQRLASGDKIFDVALLDMQMPEMDGAELGRLLRAEPYFDKMKLVMMTSITFNNEVNFFSDLGFNAYFPKPATTSDLFKALSVVVDNEYNNNKTQPMVTHDYLASLAYKNSDKITVDKSTVKILLVEDNKVNQMVAVGILKTFGFSCDVAEDGLQALNTLKQASKETPYQLIFMDCQMPVMDGYESTEKIRAGEAGEYYKEIHIIAMTANAMQGDRDKCLQCGMNDYVGKPINATLLEEKITQCLLDIAERTEKNALEESTLSEESFIVWNQSEALNRFFNDQSLLISLMTTFIEENNSKIAQLDAAIKAKNNQQVLLLAHTIKGASANLGGDKLAHYCSELELSVKSNTTDKYSLLLADIEVSYNELINSFQVYMNDSESQQPTQVQPSYEQQIRFLTQLNERLAENDYIESSELTPLMSEELPQHIQTLFSQLEQQLTLFEFEAAQQVTVKLINQLKMVNRGDV